MTNKYYIPKCFAKGLRVHSHERRYELKLDSTEMKFHFCQDERYETHTCNEFQTHMRIKRNIQRAIPLLVNSVHMKISYQFETSFRLKWTIWNPYRLEFHWVLNIYVRWNLNMHLKSKVNIKIVSYLRKCFLTQ